MYFITTKRMLEVCFFQHTPTFIIEPVFFCIYANNEPKSALARDLGDCRDNKGKLAKRVFTCLRELVLPGYIFKRNFEFTIYIDYTN